MTQHHRFFQWMNCHEHCCFVCTFFGQCNTKCSFVNRTSSPFNSNNKQEQIPSRSRGSDHQSHDAVCVFSQQMCCFRVSQIVVAHLPHHSFCKANETSSFPKDIVSHRTRTHTVLRPCRSSQPTRAAPGLVGFRQPVGGRLLHCTRSSSQSSRRPTKKLFKHCNNFQRLLRVLVPLQQRPDHRVVSSTVYMP